MSVVSRSANYESDESKGASVFFEPGKLSGLEKMRFTSRRRVEGAYSGRHVATRRGGSGEFVDYREYAPGDDLRRLDWKVMFRTGRTYLKLYQDETDLLCTVLIDVSGSMRQGGRGWVQGGTARRDVGSKLEWAQYFATALTHLIVLSRDAVGLAVVSEGLTEYFSPSSSVQHRALLHSKILQLEAKGVTELSKGLDDVMMQAKRRGVLLVLSDFLVDNMDSLGASIRKFRARGWEVIALHIVHPEEESLPAGNAFQFVGLEGDGTVNCQLSEIRAAYEQRFLQHLVAVRGTLVSTGCDYHLARTSQSYLDVLRSFLVVRSN